MINSDAANTKSGLEAVFWRSLWQRRFYICVGKSIILCTKPSVELLVIKSRLKKKKKKTVLYKTVGSMLNHVSRGIFLLIFCEFKSCTCCHHSTNAHSLWDPTVPDLLMAGREY